MKAFRFKHSPGRIDGLRVVANIGEKNSVQRIPEPLAAGQSYRWIPASIVASGSVCVKSPNGVTFTLERGGVLPSLTRVGGDVVEEALEDDTLIYCFQSEIEPPMWKRGYVIQPGVPITLSPRDGWARVVLVSGQAICNGTVEMNATLAPHVLRVSPGKTVEIVGDGVLLYMFPANAPAGQDPATDDDPLLSDFMKGLTLLSAERQVTC